MTNRKGLIAFGISTIITLSAVSCIEIDKSLGTGYIPSNYELNLNSAEFSVPVQMSLPDSIQTIYSGYNIFGAYRDPLFGEVTSKALFAVVPGTTNNDFGDNPTVNYCRMYINLSSQSILNPWEAAIPQNIYVYRLNTDLDTLKPYNNSYTSSDYNPIPVNDRSVYLTGDSIVCNLSPSFATELLSATKLERDSAKHFIKRFKGFCIGTDPVPGSLSGGRFNLSSMGNIYIELSYRHKDASKGIDKDSLLYYYSDDSNPYLNIITHSSKPLETTLPSQKIYIEGLAGIKPFIDFSTIKSDISEWAQTSGFDLKKVIISKAELVFPYEFPSDYRTMNQYPSKVFLATRELDTNSHLLYYKPISDLNIDGSDGSVNRVTYDYKLNITNYIQKLISNRYANDRVLKAWLFPILSTSNNYSGATSYYIENTAYYKAILNGNLAQRAPKLVLTYSILK